jgi:hypothetical protein
MFSIFKVKMKKDNVSGKKNRKGISRRAFRIFFRVFIPVFCLLLLACLGLFLTLKPQPIWIVEDNHVKAWENILNAGSPALKAKLVPLSGAAPRRKWYGYRIGSVREDQAAGSENAVTVYRRLAAAGKYGDALPLALDPWLVFHKFTVSPMSWATAENGAGASGRIFLAGTDPAAVRAWTAQLLQETPGVFPQVGELWHQTGERLFLERRFQNGSRTYTWEEIWPHLLTGDENVWVYAPLSRLRKLPLHETNTLEADVFPGRPGWNEFGIQAEIFWAVPFGSAKNREKLQAAEEWLRSAALQSLAADTLDWISAHPESPPYNPISGSARIAWLTASYVWE